MRQSGEYGDHIAVIGLAEFIGCPLLVYRKLQPEQKPTLALPLNYSADEASEPLCLLLDETPGQPEHYTALTIRDQEPPPPDHARAGLPIARPDDREAAAFAAARALRADGKTVRQIARTLKIPWRSIAAMELPPPGCESANT